MKESQNIEWKKSWRNEYIKWICGFANANGGTLYIGKDDKGKVTGISDVGKLLKDIPNKVRDILGIMIDVNLITEKGKDILEIIVESYPYPVSYKGQYHYRSGSTKQELRGAALDKFLLRKQGKHWDGVPVPHVFVKDLDDHAFEYFRKKAAQSKRLTSEVLEEKNDILIEKLHLTDNQYLKRAAVLLFHPDPEKFVTGAYVKIGYFKTDDDLLFQDEINGNLFSQVEKTMDLLLTKYLKATIEYKGVSRIEEYPFPEAAIREALLNSIAHKDYSSANPIQISVYNDKIIFWNEGQLPENWTISQLKEKHPSKPFNPVIANVFFRAGLIEAWGRGIFKIINACRISNSAEPVFKCDLSGFFVELIAQKIGTLGEKLGEKLGENRLEIIKLMQANQQISIAELSRQIGISTTAIERNIKYLKEKEIIKRVGAAKGGHWEAIIKK